MCIIWNWFIETKIILISQKIFVLKLFRMVANQSTLGQLSNFGRLSYVNPVKFTEERVMCAEK